MTNSHNHREKRGGVTKLTESNGGTDAGEDEEHGGDELSDVRLN